MIEMDTSETLAPARGLNSIEKTSGYIFFVTFVKQTHK